MTDVADRVGAWIGTDAQIESHGSRYASEFDEAYLGGFARLDATDLRVRHAGGKPGTTLAQAGIESGMPNLLAQSHERAP